MRISIRGVSCSGKSTLAKNISEKLNISHIEQDQIFWQPGWESLEEDKFKSVMQEKVKKDSWVICGNYSKVSEVIKERVTHIIWLNYSFKTIVARSMKRTANRVFRREMCCNGNYETFRHAYMSKDSIFYWILKTYRLRKKQCSVEKEKLKGSEVQFLEFTSPDQTQEWLDSLA